jgi:glycosyltransferase involved in cell wall biosynthesis
MRILIYSWPFAPTIGGLERLSELTARQLVERGHAVVLVTATLDPAAMATRFPFEVIRRPTITRLDQLIRATDVIHLNTFNGRLVGLAFLRQRPVVWQHIDYDTITPRGICYAHGTPCVFAPRRCYSCLRRDHSAVGAARAIASLLAKRAAIPHVGTHIINTRYAQRQMQLPQPHFVSFGIDTERLVPPSHRQSGALRVLFFARHIPAKGCDVLIRALGRLKAREVRFQARIAGDGVHRPQSEALARHLGLGGDAAFLGFLSEEQLLMELQEANVVAIPTLQDEIGQLVASEAMSCGCAVVASAIGAFPELLDGVGVLFPPGDDAALALNLEQLARDRGRLTGMGEAGRRKAVEEFDVRIMVDRYLQVYDTVLATHGPA